MPEKLEIPRAWLDTDGTLAANSDSRIATQKAIKTYVGASFAPTYQSLTATAGGLAGYDCTYVLAAGTAGKAKADAVATVYAIGFAPAAGIAAGASGNIQTAGVVTNPAWAFTKGLPVYISPVTAGVVTQTAPTAGQQSQVVGIALTATSLLIQIGPVVEVGSGLTLPLSGTIASSATPYPSSDGTATGTMVEFFTITALATAAELQAPIGSPTNGQRLLVRILDNGTARALTYNAIFRDDLTELTLPTTTTLGKTLYINFIYNSADSKWDYIGYRNNL